MVCDVRGLFESVYATLGSSARAIIGSSSPLTPDSLQSLMEALGGVRDQCFVAFGSGPGHAVLAADKLGATFSFGIELLSNADAIAVNFLKAAKDLSCNSSKLLLVQENDFCSAGVPFNPTIGISYWDGFALSDRLELLRDIRITSSLNCVALSLVEDPTTEDILGSLNSGSTCVRWEHRGHLPSGGELSYLYPFPSDLCLSIIDFQASESGHGKRIRSDTQGVPMADWLDLGRVFHEYDLSIACSTKKSVLGKGGYGTVVKLYHSASKSYVAAKIQTKSTYQNCSNNPLMRECSILGYCGTFRQRSVTPELKNFLNGCSFAQISTSLGNTYNVLLMESLHGDCVPIMKEFQGFISRERQIQDAYRLLFREVILALSHVHEHGLAHNDLKPSNIFVVFRMDTKEILSVRLGDWGLGVQGLEGRQYSDKNEPQSSFSEPQSAASVRVGQQVDCLPGLGSRRAARISGSSSNVFKTGALSQSRSDVIGSLLLQPEQGAGVAICKSRNKSKGRGLIEQETASCSKKQRRQDALVSADRQPALQRRLQVTLYTVDHVNRKLKQSSKNPNERDWLKLSSVQRYECSPWL